MRATRTTEATGHTARALTEVNTMMHPNIGPGAVFLTAKSGDRVTALEEPVHRSGSVWSVAVEMFTPDGSVIRWTSITTDTRPIAWDAWRGDPRPTDRTPRGL